MNKLISWIYIKSPFYIQNVLVSIYGWKLVKERYSKGSGSFLEDLKKSQWLSCQELLKKQEESFIKLAKEAVETVPYYRKVANERGFDSSDITSIKDINRFPIIKKEYIRKNPVEFVSEKYDPKKLLKIFTSGTTGTPLTVYCNKVVRSKHYAFFSRLRSWFNVASKSKRATFFGRVIMSPDLTNPPFWRYDYFQNNLLMSSYHLNDNSIYEYYKKLCAYGPEEIIGYPSSLYQFSRYVVFNNLDPINVKVVICTAEMLYDYQKSMIKRAFSAPLINQYGCTEMAFFASDCEEDTMHCHPEHGIMEIENERSEILPYGSGRLITTGLINNVMPLIRYDIGDLIDLQPLGNMCKCGRCFPVIRYINGRSDDIVYKSDGTPVGRLGPIFKGGVGIVAAQIVQNEDLSIDIYIKPDNNFDKKNEKVLMQEMRNRVGTDIKVRIYKKEDLPRGSGGKFKTVIGKYKPH